MQYTHWMNPLTGTFLITEEEIVTSIVTEGCNTINESGGVLIGQRKGQHFHIKQLTFPMTGDVRSRFGIRRSARRHNSIIQQAIKSSGGEYWYLGEWHTHPQRIPTPSNTDFATWKRIYNEIKIPIVCLIGGSEAIVAYETKAGISMRMEQIPEGI